MSCCCICCACCSIGCHVGHATGQCTELASRQRGALKIALLSGLASARCYRAFRARAPVAPGRSGGRHSRHGRLPDRHTRRRCCLVRGFSGAVGIARHRTHDNRAGGHDGDRRPATARSSCWTPATTAATPAIRPRSTPRSPTAAAASKACDTTGTATNAGYSEHAFTWDVACESRPADAAGVRVVLSRPERHRRRAVRRRPGRDGRPGRRSGVRRHPRGRRRGERAADST